LTFLRVREANAIRATWHYHNGLSRKNLLRTAQGVLLTGPQKARGRRVAKEGVLGIPYLLSPHTVRPFLDPVNGGWRRTQNWRKTEYLSKMSRPAKKKKALEGEGAVGGK